MKLELIVHKNSSLQGSPKVSKATLSRKVLQKNLLKTKKLTIPEERYHNMVRHDGSSKNKPVLLHSGHTKRHVKLHQINLINEACNKDVQGCTHMGHARKFSLPASHSRYATNSMLRSLCWLS